MDYAARSRWHGGPLEITRPLQHTGAAQAFGGWAQADKAHFADGASVDQIYTRK